MSRFATAPTFIPVSTGRNKRDVIRYALDSATSPDSVITRVKSIGQVAEGLMRHEMAQSPSHPRPGEITNILKMLPPDQRLHVAKAAIAMEDARDFGKHASHEVVYRAFDVAPTHRDILNRITDGLEVDQVVRTLTARKSDADLPPPELTRRDHLRAAFDAHNPDSTED